jgi:Leucine-rich repeat (LRR) protein
LPALEEFHVENGGDGATCPENKGIAGALPSDLANASALRVIGTYCNSFTGTLDVLVSPKLEIADLHHNNFTGTLPDLLHCASTMTYISVANNKLTGAVPASWKALSKLETMGLAYNNFSGSIDWLTADIYPALKVCFIRANSFSGTIPGKLPSNLAVFDADGNKFTAIDPAICTSPVPAFGNAGGCGSDWPTQSFGTCCFSGNPLGDCNTTALSCVVENCGTCITCKGESARVDLAQCSAWQDLYDSTNGPKWEDCSELRSDPCACFLVNCEGGQNITKIKLLASSLSGSIPSSFGQLVELVTINFNYNSLSGSIPSSLGKLVKLEFLDLSENRLSGSIPSELGQLPKLDWINLHTNRLTGLVPPLPFAQYTDPKYGGGCALDWPSYCINEPNCNHFKCPLPAGSEQCKAHAGDPGVHCK